ncbi:putative C-type lectin domain family 20 member A [Channa argus]|uniref:putative C-type lectin domain family 20 member A n=1 Tax=Channa argus TaxID=215402 RepID=UPI00351FCD99
MGQCSFFTCQLYEFHFIKENKTWDEAQNYCREKYTDLATVSNMTDMKRLLNSIESQDEAWIGLHSYPANNSRAWHWSLPGVEFYENKTRWDAGQPDDHGGQLENCAVMTDNKWSDYPCTRSLKFICYNGEDVSVFKLKLFMTSSCQTFVCYFYIYIFAQNMVIQIHFVLIYFDPYYTETNQSNTTCHMISDTMTWSQAQSYCRVNHTDLISGLDQLDNCAESRSDMSGTNMWIGLFRDTWMWSDGSSFSFRYWESLSTNDLVDGQSNKNCATTVLNRAGKWSFDYCINTKPFICYGALKMKQHLVELTLSVNVPTVDMEDPAVAEALLKQLEEKFRGKGISVKLSWRRLPEKSNTKPALEQCGP